jgi:hypothetical protein
VTNAQHGADVLIAQVGGAETTYEAQIEEDAGRLYLVHWDVGDKCTIYDSRRSITVHDWITEVTLTLDAPGPYELDIKLGKEPVFQSPPRP